MDLKLLLTDIQFIKMKINPDCDLDDVEEAYDRACSMEEEIKILIRNSKEPSQSSESTAVKK